MKAIETEYKGVRFRSRLEARWAFVLDRLGVEWRYEHEGYDLPSGKYLPDFWLPQIEEGTWLEIKPVWPTETEILLGWDLALHTHKPCVIAIEFESILVLPKEGPYKDEPPIRSEDARRFLVNLLRVWVRQVPPTRDPNQLREVVSAAVAATPFHDAIRAARAHRFWNPREA